jgi:flagellar motor switch protein FliN/FliY
LAQSLKTQDAAGAIARHLETSLASALSSMTGKDFSVVAKSTGDSTVLAEAMVWRQSFSFSAEPALWLVAGRDLWTAAGELTLAGVGIDSLTDEDCRSTWQEIAGQTMGALATSLSDDLQHEVTASKGEEADEEPGHLDWTLFSVSAAEGPGWMVKAAWAHSLVAIYNPTVPTEKTAGPSHSSFSKTLDLLLDVALPVSVSFGRTSLQIREVLKLNTGSIVELNRFVAEPVDVIVNDCVIARGEVVVVDGNYGVRITQLSSREDRLRTGMKDSPVRVGEPLR